MSRFTRKVLRQFTEWASTKIPNPLETLRNQIAGFTPELQQIIIKDALGKGIIEKARMRLDPMGEEVQDLLGTPEGQSYLVFLLALQHQPNTTEREVEELLAACEQEHGSHYIAVKMGQVTGKLPIDESEAERLFLIEAGLLPAPKEDPSKKKE